MSSDNQKEPAVGFAAGTKIGKYEVRERLGIGGQAIVYKAYDAWLDRYVAIKQISSHLAADPKFLERFRREAQILAKLGNEQPAIVTIHELIQDEKGLFIVMEFVAGQTLEAVLQDNPGPFEPKAVLAILWRLAAGLHAVHSAGIIHRDIKPSNIIIGEALKAKITDFGVAASSTGQTSMVLGTTKYMAPELYEGKTVDARVDVYSLGFIAYEMLLGRAKFNEIFNEIVRDKHSEALRWMKWHGNAQVQAPALSQVNPAIPQALSDLVANMIAKDPAKRYDSMEALGRAMKANFSPRAARNGAAQPPAANGHAEKQSAKGDSGLSLPVAREDEELELSAGPATAPLPKKKLTLKSKLLIAGIAGFLLMAVMVGIIVNGLSGRQNRLQQAQLKFASAEAAYHESKFADAASAYEDVASHYADSNESAMAAVLWHLAKAQATVDEAAKVADDKARLELWDHAVREQDNASAALKKVQAQKPNLYGWTQTAGREIENFTASRVSTRGICEAMAKASQLAAQNKFDLANEALNDGLNNRQIHPTPAQEEQLSQFRRKLAVGQLDFAFQAHMTAGNAAVKDKKFELAKGEFVKAGQLLADDSAALVPADKIDQYKQQLHKAQDQLAALNAYVNAMAQAEQARSDKDRAKELASLEAALKAQPTPELAQQVKDLQAQVAIDEGVKLFSEGNADAARAAFEKSLKVKETPEARRQLEKLQKLQDFSSRVAAAEAAFDKGDFKTAMEKYQDAAAADPDSGEVQGKIRLCDYNMKLAQAKALGDEKKYADAYKLLDACRKLVPDKAAEIDATYAALKQNGEFDDAVASGKELLKARQWTRAREEFNKAQKIRPSQETADLIKLSYYSENLAQGASAMDQNNYADARAYFKVAQTYLNTDEIKKLIDQMEQKLKDKP